MLLWCVLKPRFRFEPRSILGLHSDADPKILRSLGDSVKVVGLGHQSGKGIEAIHARSVARP